MQRSVLHYSAMGPTFVRVVGMQPKKEVIRVARLTRHRISRWSHLYTLQRRCAALNTETLIWCCVRTSERVRPVRENTCVFYLPPTIRHQRFTVCQEEMRRNGSPIQLTCQWSLLDTDRNSRFPRNGISSI